MCAGCPKPEMLARMKSRAAELEKRKIITSEKGLSVSGLLWIQGMKGVTVIPLYEDGLQKYIIEVDNTERHDAVLEVVKTHRPVGVRR